jgi:hypothetical protein
MKKIDQDVFIQLVRDYLNYNDMNLDCQKSRQRCACSQCIKSRMQDLLLNATETPPKYVKGVKDIPAMIYEQYEESSKYYRPAGDWYFDYEYIDGKLMSKLYYDIADIDPKMQELIPITDNEFYDSNYGYVTKPKDYVEPKSNDAVSDDDNDTLDKMKRVNDYHFLGKKTLTGLCDRGHQVNFVLDGVTYSITEDEEDGWRSSLGHFCINTSKNVEMKYFEEIVVNITMVQDTYQLHDKDKNLIFEFGTNNNDDYYPSYVCDINYNFFRYI